MKVFMFNHSGCLNRGCEAIVKGTINILDEACGKNEYVLLSYAPQEDKNLFVVARVVTFEPRPLNKMEHIIAALNIKIKNDERYSVIKSYSSFFEEAEKADICLSVGGDTYCYGDNAVISILTTELKRRGKKIVLWGASIGEEDLTAEKEKNLVDFDAIFVREPLTFEILLNRAINPNIFLFPDPAFTLKNDELPLPQGWQENNTVGINISSIVINHNPQLITITVDLIKHILYSTKMSVALIPHVTASNNDDMPGLEALLDEVKEDAGGRIFILPATLSAEQYKGYIARLRFFIGARTHAAIAAYSNGVPTIVLGYSAKSRGIAVDLFGKEEFVIDAQTLQSGAEFIVVFEALQKQEIRISKTLTMVIPGKIQAAYAAGIKLFEI
ncbi:MAG: polysaccharide pyruvyl transferase family protein [Eubacteriales bacterium]